jgi:exonuclease I
MLHGGSTLLATGAQQIYGGFFSDEDREIMVAFHESDWNDRFELSQQLKDARLRKIAQRVLFTEAPESLPPEIRFLKEREFAARLLAEQSEWLTLPKAIEQTDDLLKTAKEELKPFLIQYRAYLDQRLDGAIAKAA